MRVAGIIRESLQDGMGCNLVVFTQGCSIRCAHCHNPETWEHSGGVEMSVEEIMQHVTPVTSGITISGGEPTEQPEELLMLLRHAKARGLNTTLYSGLTIKQFVETPVAGEAFMLLDYAKLGPYIHELRDTSKGMTGSSNQKFMSQSELFMEICYAEKENEDERVHTDTEENTSGAECGVLTQGCAG